MASQCIWKWYFENWANLQFDKSWKAIRCYCRRIIVGNMSIILYNLSEIVKKWNGKVLLKLYVWTFACYHTHFNSTEIIEIGFLSDWTRRSPKYTHSAHNQPSWHCGCCPLNCTKTNHQNERRNQMPWAIFNYFCDSTTTNYHKVNGYGYGQVCARGSISPGIIFIFSVVLKAHKGFYKHTKTYLTFLHTHTRLHTHNSYIVWVKWIQNSILHHSHWPSVDTLWIIQWFWRRSRKPTTTTTAAMVLIKIYIEYRLLQSSLIYIQHIIHSDENMLCFNHIISKIQLNTLTQHHVIFTNNSKSWNWINSHVDHLEWKCENETVVWEFRFFRGFHLFIQFNVWVHYLTSSLRRQKNVLTMVLNRSNDITHNISLWMRSSRKLSQKMYTK